MFTYRFIFLILFFGCTFAACGILVPQPVPPAVEACLNHWTSRKFPTYRFLYTCNFLSLYWDSWSVSCLCIQCPKESFYCSESLPGWRHARELFQSPHPPRPQVEISRSCRWGTTGCSDFPSPCYIVQGEFLPERHLQDIIQYAILAKIELQSTLTACCRIPEPLWHWITLRRCL